MAGTATLPDILSIDGAATSSSRRPLCPTCHDPIVRVVHCLGEQTFVEPCMCPVTHQLDADGALDAADEPSRIRTADATRSLPLPDPRVALARADWER